jgi:hypothetical protein
MGDLKLKIVECDLCINQVSVLFGNKMRVYEALLELGWRPDFMQEDTWTCQECSEE